MGVAEWGMLGEGGVLWEEAGCWGECNKQVSKQERSLETYTIFLA